MFHNHQKTCIVFATPFPAKAGPEGQPVLLPLSPNWLRARMGMQIPTNINTAEMRADGMEVGVARSMIAAQCLAMEPEPEFVFFMDWDVLMPPDALTKLFMRARCFPKHDIYAGIYCCKWREQPEPLIYGEHGQGPIWDFTVGDLLTTESHNVRSVHMGLTLVRVSAFRKLIEAGLVTGDGTDETKTPFFKTTDEYVPGIGKHQGTEDIWFCDLLQKAGGSILVDTGVLAGHEDMATGRVYGLPVDRHGPVGRARWMTGVNGKTGDATDAASATAECSECIGRGLVGAKRLGVKCKKCKGTGVVRKPLKLALDLGAGSLKRHWPDHTTYTTDLRTNVGADYIQDTRMLTLPDNHFHLVASAHHLEHLGRWDQEGVFREMARITKPGGKWEHIVPSIEWAAQKVAAGETDGHVLNVLYGSQEAGGMERQFNVHYFCYTKQILAALATQAGMVDVVTSDWRDDENHLFELKLTARKPLPSELKKKAKRRQAART